uniref:Uncharacterized protein n=1 Tax=Anguilla anguilla TaxID=7936 RepID=A0A0E9X3F7_ANGAN
MRLCSDVTFGYFSRISNSQWKQTLWRFVSSPGFDIWMEMLLLSFFSCTLSATKIWVP